MLFKKLSCLQPLIERKTRVGNMQDAYCISSSYHQVYLMQIIPLFFFFFLLDMQRSLVDESNLWRKLWWLEIHQRHKMMLWRIAAGVLLATRKNQQQRNYPSYSILDIIWHLRNTSCFHKDKIKHVLVSMFFTCSCWLSCLI